MEKLKKLLRDIDGKSYKLYKGLKGRYNFKGYKVEVIRVQGDPYASPSLISCECNLKELGYQGHLYDNPSKRTAFEDYIQRKIYKDIKNLKGGKKVGKGGDIGIAPTAYKIIRRSGVTIVGDRLIYKLYVGLPARGRTILSRECSKIFFEKLDEIYNGVKEINVGREKLELHIKTNERSDEIRKKLSEYELITFIGNGSNLPRISPVDKRPLNSGVKFFSPKEVEVEITLDSGEKIKGMGIKEGVTIITGGGFHGKSTLLNSIEEGVYNHIPGDGRELVITREDAVKIRAEDGRYINKTNISDFIDNLPHKKDTKRFSTENASGSTSQGGNISEALELGSRFLLIDEDTTATNFMIRDRKVQELISKEKEPIKPFIEKIKTLYEKNGVSSIIVVGGLGEFFGVSHKIFMMDNYKVLDVTEKAKEISRKYTLSSIVEDEKKVEVSEKVLVGSKCKSLFNYDRNKIKSRGLDELSINKEGIDIRSLEQLVESNQVPFIGSVIKKEFISLKEDIPLRELLEKVIDNIEKKGIKGYLNDENGSLTYARKYEIGAVINRIRRDLFL